LVDQLTRRIFLKTFSYHIYKFKLNAEGRKIFLKLIYNILTRLTRTLRIGKNIIEEKRLGSEK